MVAFYVKRIRAGKMTLEEVPPRWHDAVEAELNK
jgi:hypothetical protein